MRTEMQIAAKSYAVAKSWDEIFNDLIMQYEDTLQQNKTELLA